MRGQIHNLWLLADRGDHLSDQRPQTHQKRSNVTPHALPKLKRPLYARLKEMGEFFPVVLWPLLKERKNVMAPSNRSLLDFTK